MMTTIRKRPGRRATGFFARSLLLAMVLVVVSLLCVSLMPRAEASEERHRIRGRSVATDKGAAATASEANGADADSRMVPPRKTSENIRYRQPFGGNWQQSGGHGYGGHHHGHHDGHSHSHSHGYANNNQYSNNGYGVGSEQNTSEHVFFNGNVYTSIGYRFQNGRWVKYYKRPVPPPSVHPPTPIPSATNKPTVKPTFKPTVKPSTRKPTTRRPTSRPTRRPTRRPSRKPTQRPTRRPTRTTPFPTLPPRPTPFPTKRPFPTEPPHETCSTVAEIVCQDLQERTSIFCDMATNVFGLDKTYFAEDSPPATVFVPTDDAILEWGSIYGATDEIESSQLESVLLYHIGLEAKPKDGDGNSSSNNNNNNSMSGAYSFEDLPCKGLLVTASEGRSSRTKCEDQDRRKYQKGRGNTDESIPFIIDPDHAACYGHIVHVVDHVILPEPVAIDEDEETTDKLTDIPAEKPTERPTDKPAEKPTERPTDKPADPLTDLPTEPPTADDGEEHGTWYPTYFGTTFNSFFGTSSYGTYPPTVTAFPTAYYYWDDDLFNE